jgi:cysteine-rich repeat protein
MHPWARAQVAAWAGLFWLPVWADCGQQPQKLRGNDASQTVLVDAASEVVSRADGAAGLYFPDVQMIRTCGNRLLDSGEACDDGNAVSGDGCSADCTTVEPGWKCPYPPGLACLPICGDGILAGDEACDDGNLYNGDGCSAHCLIEPGWDCTSGTCVPVGALDAGVDGAFCGDGVVAGAEECDLGEQNGRFAGRGGCSIGCTSLRFCGDGVLDVKDGEDCDLGALNGLWLDKSMNPSTPTDGALYCTSDCMIPTCCVF